MLEAIISAAVSFAVSLLTAYFLWRDQARGKRRQEVAEAALVACREALDAISWCLLESKGFPDANRPAELSESQRKNKFAEFELMKARLDAKGELIARLEVHRLLCAIHVGTNAASEIERIRGLFWPLRRLVIQGLAAGRALTDLEPKLAGPDVSDSLRLRARDEEERIEQVRTALFSDSSEFSDASLEALFQSVETSLTPAIRYNRTSPWRKHS